MTTNPELSQIETEFEAARKDYLDGRIDTYEFRAALMRLVRAEDAALHTWVNY